VYPRLSKDRLMWNDALFRHKSISSSTSGSQNRLIMELRDVETGVLYLIIGLEISEYEKLVLFLKIRYTVGSILSEIGLKVLGAAHNLL
jgi:hypothetical protein